MANRVMRLLNWQKNTTQMEYTAPSLTIRENIKNKKKLTVITNSIENLLELSDISGWNIISTGGTLKGDSMSFLGIKAADSIEQYNADKVFLSCKGLDIQKGITEGNDETGCIKQSMIKSAKKVYLTVDSSKFDKVAFSNICPLSRLDVVVTDQKPDERWMEAFEKNEIECIYPKDISENN